MAEALHAWGYHHFDTEAVRTVVELLVTAAVKDGGDRLSVHLADRQDHALVLVLSSGPCAERPDDDSLLHAVAAQGAADCGTAAAEDGRRRWALLDLTPQARPTCPSPATVRGSTAFQRSRPPTEVSRRPVGPVNAPVAPTAAAATHAPAATAKNEAGDPVGPQHSETLITWAAITLMTRRLTRPQPR